MLQAEAGLCLLPRESLSLSPGDSGWIRKGIRGFTGRILSPAVRVGRDGMCLPLCSCWNGQGVEGEQDPSAAALAHWLMGLRRAAAAHSPYALSH